MEIIKKLNSEFNLLSTNMTLTVLLTSGKLETYHNVDLNDTTEELDFWCDSKTLMLASCPARPARERVWIDFSNILGLDIQTHNIKTVTTYTI